MNLFYTNRNDHPIYVEAIHTERGWYVKSEVESFPGSMELPAGEQKMFVPRPIELDEPGGP